MPGVSMRTSSLVPRPFTAWGMPHPTRPISLVHPPRTLTSATYSPTSALISADLPLLTSPKSAMSTRPVSSLRAMSVNALHSCTMESRSFGSAERTCSSVRLTVATASWKSRSWSAGIVNSLASLRISAAESPHAFLYEAGEFGRPCHFVPLLFRQTGHDAGGISHLVAEVRDEHEPDPACDERLDNALQCAPCNRSDSRDRFQRAGGECGDRRRRHRHTCRGQ